MIIIKGCYDSGKTLIAESLTNHPEVDNTINSHIHKDRLVYEEDKIPLLKNMAYKRTDDHNDPTVIIIVRDPRISWLITEHKPNTYRYDYLLSDNNERGLRLLNIDHFILNFKRFEDFSTPLDNEMLVKTEDLFVDIHGKTKEIFEFCDLDYKKEYLWKEYRPIDKNISLYDFERIYKYKNLINIDELKKITDECSDFLKLFGYEKHINLYEMLYPVSKVLNIGKDYEI